MKIVARKIFMKPFKPIKKHSAEINITSLIDIIFILLIFFMVTSTFLKPAIEIKLPVAAHEDKTEREIINVFVGEDLTLFLEEEKISIEELQDSLIDASMANPEVAIMLFCDKNLVFENVVEMMDLFKKSGIKNVAIGHTGGAN